MKSLKKISIVSSLWFVVGFLAGAALAATAESRSGLESGGHNALASTTTTTAQVSTGNCVGSNCSTNALVTLSRLHGSPVSAGTWTFPPSDGRALSVSNMSGFNSSPSGVIAVPNGADRITRNPSNLAVKFSSPMQQPQLHLTSATMRSGIGSAYFQGSGGGIGSMIRQLFCSPPAREDCISDNLFNSNPTIKSEPTGKVTLAPEPTAAFLLGTGLLAIGLIRRRQKTDRT